MIDDFNKLNQNFKNGFNAAYYAKVHCPVCKEKIFANALVCPNCTTDFRQKSYKKRKSWQRIVMRVALLISVVAAIGIWLSGAPLLIGVFVGIILFGGVYILVQKIQSFKNYHQK